MVLSIHTFTLTEVEEQAMNEPCRMIAGESFQSEGLARFVLRAMEPSFSFFPLSDWSSMLDPIFPPTSCFILISLNLSQYF